MKETRLSCMELTSELDVFIMGQLIACTDTSSTQQHKKKMALGLSLIAMPFFFTDYAFWKCSIFFYQLCSKLCPIMPVNFARESI